jgi:hypothetical protein
MAPNPLPFRMQLQGCTEWCWAAAVASVASFVGADNPPQQCEIVDQEAFSPNNPSPGCCSPANRCTPGQTNQVCNRRGNVGSALGDYNLTADSGGQIPTADDFASITQQIDACSVVVIQVVDRTNSALQHILVITGYADADTVCVADPADPQTHFTYSYSALFNPSSNTCNWLMLRMFTTVPGVCNDGG